MSLGDTAVFNDRYEIQQRLGRGGMADVYLARDRLLERRVAVKVLFPEFATDPSFVARFRREAQAAANLTHPNIVAVYDWGQQGGTYFIVMEYVNGRTLAEVLRADGKLAPVQAATVSSEVAAALGFAHRNGVVHRDVKPGNILVTASGDVKVADFGIARVANAGTDAGLTQAGSVMGTAAYFSPEQAQGATPDPRSDLYSLGIVMYEMVGGRPPFTGDNPVSIAYKQVHEAPPRLRDLTPDVPVAYEAIVAKLLAKNPAARYATADDLRLDLTRFRDGQRPEALAQAAAAAGVGGAAAVAAAATTVNPPVPSAYGQPTTVVAAAPGTQVLPLPAPARDAAPAPADLRRAAPHRAAVGGHHPRPARARHRRLPALQGAQGQRSRRAHHHRDARADEQAARRGHQGPHRPRLRGQDHADAAGQRRRRREHRLRAGPGHGHRRADGRQHHADLQPAEGALHARQLRRRADRRRQGRARPGQGAVPGDRGRVGPPGRRGALAGPGRPAPSPATRSSS